MAVVMGGDKVTEMVAGRVVIVGLGLMGGSLALALRGRVSCLVGVTRRPEAAAEAVQREVVDEATTDVLAALRQADVVVLATPVRTILRLLEQLAPALPPGSLLLDLGSTKAEIVAAMSRLPAGVHAVGGHPMCGKEKAGLDAADARLFEGRAFLLCPPSGVHSQALARAEALARAIGANPLVIDAKRHDLLVAAVSHLPYLLSAALVEAATHVAQMDPLLLQVAADGFRDTSRLAGTDVVMMRDILMTNRNAVLGVLADCQAWLEAMQRSIEASDAGEITAALAQVQEHQRRLRS